VISDADLQVLNGLALEIEASEARNPDQNAVEELPRLPQEKGALA
jgi:hypothetical protein